MRVGQRSRVKKPRQLLGWRSHAPPLRAAHGGSRFPKLRVGFGVPFQCFSRQILEVLAVDAAKGVNGPVLGLAVVLKVPEDGHLVSVPRIPYECLDTLEPVRLVDEVTVVLVREKVYGGMWGYFHTGGISSGT